MSKQKKDNLNSSDREWLEAYVSLPENKVRMILHKTILGMAVRIKQERQKKDLTLDRLSEITGKSKTALIRIEKGQGYNISTFIEICIALGIVPTIDFLEVDRSGSNSEL